MGWINNGTDRETVLAAAPEIADKFDTFYASLWRQSHVNGEVLELCRLRLAQLLRSSFDMQRQDHPLPAHKRENVSKWNTDNAFSEADRACLGLAEVYAMDPASITDEQAEAVKQHFGDKGFVVLLEALGVFDGMARMSLLWQLPASGDSK
ncbi:MAG: hypothetical protein AB8C02_16595 [Halioglobus sp.]